MNWRCNAFVALFNAEEFCVDMQFQFLIFKMSLGCHLVIFLSGEGNSSICMLWLASLMGLSLGLLDCHGSSFIIKGVLAVQLAWGA